MQKTFTTCIPINPAAKYKDHALGGDWQGFRDCHIQNDLLLIYRVNGDTLELARLNTHAAIFG